MAEDGMYLENLDEYINDENKIVTYKWLSRTLSVHVNTAKQMLYAFAQKDGGKDLHITYLVIGVSHNKDDKVHIVQIVPDDKLDSFKATLDSITSCHIYSIQKARLKDTNALYMADYELTKSNILQSNDFSAVTCPVAKPRSEEELRRLKVKAQPTKQAPNFSKPTEKVYSSAANKKKTDIGSMFANQKKKSPEKKEPPPKEKSEDSKVSNKSTAKSKANEKPTKSKQGGLSTFFANQAARPKKEKPPAEEKEKEIPVEKNLPEKKPSTQKPAEKKPSRRKNNNSHDEGSEKKRRRIQNRVWSDSSEEDEEEMEVEQPPSPPAPEESLESEPETIEDEDTLPVETQMDTCSSGKRRKRTKKMVSKTYVNEEGYMVTEKVMESASETDQSEAEEAPPPKAPPKTSPTKDKANSKTKKKEKASPVKAKKQGNIMSFFKKK